MKFDYKLEFHNMGRWVAHYEKDGVIHEFVTPDWAVNRFGEEPTLVEEVDEIFSLNFLYLYNLEQARKAATQPAEASPAA